MLRNYFLIAARNLWRNKGFSAVNIFGLAVGIATCLVIMLYLQHELSYDRYNKKADRMYRVVFNASIQGEPIKEASIMPPVAQALKTEFPEVQAATRIRSYGTPRITYGDKTFKEDAFAFVDSNFFQVFSIPLIRGDAKTALLQPNTVVIASDVAKRYFGSDNPIGKVLIFKDNNAALTVTGVIDKVPDNSHFHFSVFASMSGLAEAKEQSWMVSNFFTYLVLPEGYDYKKLEAKLPMLVDKYMGPQIQQAMGVTLAQFRQNGNRLGFLLQPVTSIHMGSDLTGDMEPYGDIHYVYIFSTVAIFMLLIACINFMNLSTAGASKRAREVGIRKVMGSVKWQLIRQFLLESLLLTAIALAVGLCLVYWSLPWFNDLTGQQLSLRLTSNPLVLPGLLLFGLVTGVLAGCYPALYLSSFNPATVLKGNTVSGKATSGLRSGLVVFQFFISITLIIGTALVFKQLSYIQHKKLGYDRDQVLVVQETYWLGKNQDVFRQQLLQDPRVLNVTTSDFLPAGSSNNNNFTVYPDDHSTDLIKAIRYDVDYTYIPTLGMELSQGRNFSRSFGADSSGVILNEAAARAFGWAQAPIGHTITRRENGGEIHTFHVIGVVKDFHYRSLHEPIRPLVMIMGTDYSNMIVKVKTGDMAGLLSSMQKKWKDLKADAPFSFSFLDDRFNNTYKEEQNIGKVLGIFAGLTIFVACLGLFGLATFTAAQRRKEIGIRKVLGAGVTSIVSLLSKDFLKLVLLAFVIATPIAWYVMDRWLQDFAYHITINAWVFVVTGIAMLLIAFLTVSIQSVKAAMANPVNSLKAE